jgi:hypothetical protein
MPRTPVSQRHPQSGRYGVHLYETQTGKKLRQFGEEDATFAGLAFAADGKCLATEQFRGAPAPNGDVKARVWRRLWDVATGQERGTFAGDYFTLVDALARSGLRDTERAR